MEFVDPFLLIATLVMTIVLILGNLYFIAHYSHHADSGIGSSTASKAVVVSIIWLFNCVDDCIHIGRMPDIVAALRCRQY